MTEYKYATGDVVYVTNMGVCIVAGWAPALCLYRGVMLEPVDGGKLLRGQLGYFSRDSVEKVIARSHEVKITARRSVRKYRIGEVVQVAGLPGVRNEFTGWVGVVMAAHRGASEDTYDILRLNGHRHRPIERITYQRLSVFHGAIKVDEQGVTTVSLPR